MILIFWWVSRYKVDRGKRSLIPHLPPISWLIKVLFPKLIQAAIAATNDLATYRLAAKITSHQYASAAVRHSVIYQYLKHWRVKYKCRRWRKLTSEQLACSLTSFFNAYAGIRTFSNSAETALTAVGLTYWPWTGDAVASSWSNTTIALGFAAVSVMIRPSAIVFWALLGFQLVRHSYGESKVDVIALFAVVG